MNAETIGPQGITQIIIDKVGAIDTARRIATVGTNPKSLEH